VFAFVDSSWDAASSRLGSFQLHAGTNSNNPNTILSGILMIGLQSAVLHDAFHTSAQNANF
jgi:hypothetical protein